MNLSIRCKLFMSLFISLATSMTVGVAHATSYTISSMEITGGQFAMEAPDFSGAVGFRYLGPDTNLVGGYIGNGGVGQTVGQDDPSSIVIFDFFFGPVNTYTAPTNLGQQDPPAGTILGGPVPFGTVDDVTGVIEMDLSAFFALWNGTDFNQGTGKTDDPPQTTSPMATGCWKGIGPQRAFVLEWASKIKGGPFDSKTGYWRVWGSATAAGTAGNSTETIDCDAPELSIVYNNGTAADTQLGSGCALGDHQSRLTGHLDWLLLAGFIAWLGWRRRGQGLRHPA